MASEKLMREQERREMRHLVTSSVPSPPFSGLSILNPATLSVFSSDPRAVLSAHLFASYAAANPEAGRFQLPLPISLVSQGQPIYPKPPTPPQLDIISSWVNDHKGKTRKKRGPWDKDQGSTNLSKDRGQGEQGGPSKEESNNNNNDNLNKNHSNQAARDKQFTCEVCNRGFGYKHVLQNHQRTHTGEKPFKCSICPKKFTRDHHLKTHMRLHTGEKPYRCSHCDRQFVQVANLRRHLRVHTGEKPYACDLCKNRFSDSNQLKAHMLIHKGEKPYSCVNCEGRFRRRHHLHNHKCALKDPLMDTGSPPTETKARVRKSRETRRIIRIDTPGALEGPLTYLPEVPEQTHPEDLSTHSLNLSSSHSSSSASPSPLSGESQGSLGLYSVESSEGAPYSTDDDEEGGTEKSEDSDD